MCCHRSLDSLRETWTGRACPTPPSQRPKRPLHSRKIPTAIPIAPPCTGARMQICANSDKFVRTCIVHACKRLCCKHATRTPLMLSAIVGRPGRLPGRCSAARAGFAHACYTVARTRVPRKLHRYSAACVCVLCPMYVRSVGGHPPNFAVSVYALRRRRQQVSDLHARISSEPSSVIYLACKAGAHRSEQPMAA